MVSKADMIRHLKSGSSVYTYDEETDCAVDREDPTSRVPVDVLLDKYRKSSGESFECIFDDHACLSSVLRCTECGTVIFSKYDEEFDPDLKCPTCSGYKTYFTYWTKDDISKDPQKQELLEMYKEFANMEKDKDSKFMKREKSKFRRFFRKLSYLYYKYTSKFARPKKTSN